MRIGARIGVLFAALAAFAAAFVAFGRVAFDAARRDSDAAGWRSQATAPEFFWSERARRDVVFAPFDAAPVQEAATRLLFAYFLDVENAAEARDFSAETREFYRTTLTEARTRFQVRRSSDAADERARRDRDDAAAARNAAETLATWRDDGPEIAADFDAATAFLREFDDGPEVAAERSLAPFATLAALEKSADFRDFAQWLNADRLVAAPVSVEAAARVAAPKALGVGSAFSCLCLLPGTFFGRLAGVDAAFWRAFLAKTRRRLGACPRFSGAVSSIFLVESFGATRKLAALASVRLLR